MNPHRPSRLALAIFDRFVDNEPLKGDLVEAFDIRRSQWWLWRQVFGAIICQRRLGAVQTRQRADLLVLGAAVLVLISFEAVFVTNLIYRLAFGPPLPNISGHFYLLQKGILDAPASDVMQRPAAWMTAPLLTIGASIPVGWLIARFHQHHYALSLSAFTFSVMLGAALNLQSPFAAQLVAMIVFILGMLAGGRLAVAADEWPARTT